MPTGVPPIYSARAEIEEAPLLCSHIRVHGAVTPRSKADSGPRYVTSHRLLCADSQCEVMSSVTSLALSYSFKSSTSRHKSANTEATPKSSTSLERLGALTAGILDISPCLRRRGKSTSHILILNRVDLVSTLETYI